MSDENGSWEDIGNEGLRVIHPDTVKQWHRRDKVERAFEASGRAIVRLAWWATIFFAGYLAALVIQAGSKA